MDYKGRNTEHETDHEESGREKLGEQKYHQKEGHD